MERLPGLKLACGGALLLLTACGGRDDRVSSDAERSPAAFATCLGCHSVEQGQANRAGPNLHGIIGQPAGAVAGFNYSKAMKESGITWTAETLDQFLAAPSKMVPGTRMTTGVSDPERRKVIVDHLAALSAAPAPQP